MTDYHLYRWSCYDAGGNFLGYVEMAVDGNPTAEDEGKALTRAQGSLQTGNATHLKSRTYLGL